MWKRQSSFSSNIWNILINLAYYNKKPHYSNMPAIIRPSA